MSGGTQQFQQLVALTPEQQQMQMLTAPLAGAPGAFEEPEVGNCTCGPALSQAACACCFWNPAIWAAGCVQVNQNEQKAALYYGKYVGTMREPGMYCLNPCGRELRPISTKCSTMELKDVKVVDSRGNPIMISGVVTYAFHSAKKACVDVEDPTAFVRMQSTTVMKQVASRYPYSAPAGQPSLQTEGPHIAAELVQALQQKVGVAGATISNFEMVDLSYAPEIAQVMLVRQQAEALVDARRLIVASAVDMATQAVEQLKAKGSVMSDAGRETMVNNLMAVICSHSSATPTVPLTK